MEISNVKKIFLLFVILLSILYLPIFYDALLKNFGFNNYKNEEEIEGDFESHHDINKNTLFENNQSYCEKSQEWSDINAELFIRRQTAKYFIDRKTLLVFTMCRTSWIQDFRFAFNVNILYNNNLISNEKHNKVKAERFISMNGYEDYSMGVALDLEEFISDYNTNNPTIISEIEIFDLKIEFFIEMQNINTNISMKSDFINANIRNFRETFKTKSAVICTEPLFLENKDYLNFEFWIELNKRIGYEKIVIFNNSIPNNDLFNDLFARNKNFVDVIQFSCLPNFIKKGDKYLRKYSEFLVGEWSMKTILFLGLDAMANNECFYRYSDRAKLILVQDNDETFIPPKLINFETSRKVFEFLTKNPNKKLNNIQQLQDLYLSDKFCEAKPNYLSSYLEKMFARDKVEQGHSIHFPQVIMGIPDLIDLIFEKINRINASLDEKSNFTNYPIKVRIQQKYNDSDPKYQSQNYGSDFTLLIRNFDEYKYAINMNFIYKNLIKKFLNENKQKLAKISELFRRFYFFNGEIKPAGYLGKSMGNPDTATFVSPHYSNGKTFTSRENYLSHFRNRHILNRGEVPITNINIDFNYFICYFIPIYENLMKTKT